MAHFQRECIHSVFLDCYLRGSMWGPTSHVLAHTWRCTTRTLLSQSTRTPSSTACRLLPIACPTSRTTSLRTPAWEECWALFLQNEPLPQVVSPKIRSKMKISWRRILRWYTVSLWRAQMHLLLVQWRKLLRRQLLVQNLMIWHREIGRDNEGTDK